MKASLNRFGLGLAVGAVSNVVVAAFTGSAFAAVSGSPIEVLVRLRSPAVSSLQWDKMVVQKSRTLEWSRSLLNAVDASGLAERDLASAQALQSDSVLKLRFETQEAADSATASLEASGMVESVSKNLWYRPLLHTVLKEVQNSETNPLAQAWSNVFNSLSARPLAENTMPEVLLPPVQTSGQDPFVTRDWAMGAIGLSPEQVSKLKLRSPITVAVIDTGVDYNHEDLIAGMWRKPGNRYEVGYDFAHGNNRPFDKRHFDLEGCMKDWGCRNGFGSEKFMSNPGHGTHCAGHVGAVMNNGLGIRGVGAGSKMMALKFFYDAGEPNAGAGDDAAAIQSIDYAIQNGAKVISASWGGRVPRKEAADSELYKALVRARDAGVLFVVAAGNDANDQEEVEDPVYPAAYDLDNLLVVAATDQNDALADFSTYGANSVHIGAPGVKILSTVTGGGYDDLVASATNAQGKKVEIQWDGTSMATPIVAGAAALLWSQHPEWTYREVRERLLSTARPVAGLAGKVSTGGVLDLGVALQ